VSDKPRYLYGRHPVAEALRGRPRDVQRLYVARGGPTERLGDLVRTAEHHGIPITEVARAALDDLVGGAPHQGIVAAVAAFAYTELTDLITSFGDQETAPLVVALDQVQDPHNLGAIIRTAFALGAHGVVIPKDNASEVTPTVVKSAAGATAHLPIVRVTNLRRALEQLKEAGLWVVGTEMASGKPVSDIDLLQPTVLVIGSEGKGMRRLVQEACDLVAHIPMPGELGSLNASVAAGIFLYEAVRQRRSSSPRP
jgi:23S rRNA (guanosine2251-2'-O)-methyltransferase